MRNVCTTAVRPSTESEMVARSSFGPATSYEYKKHKHTDTHVPIRGGARRVCSARARSASESDFCPQHHQQRARARDACEMHTHTTSPHICLLCVYGCFSDGWSRWLRAIYTNGGHSKRMTMLPFCELHCICARPSTTTSFGLGRP